VRVDLFLHQQGLDTTTPGGKAMFQMMGVFAEFERAIIQVQRGGYWRPAKLFALTTGPRKASTGSFLRIREALNKPGCTEGVRKIAERFGVAVGTVQRISRPFEGASVVAV
jgi:DNA invertase Pin-like site-specific DNA recombinase